MANGNNGLPKPDPSWIALGIVVLALMEALEDGLGRRFLDALERRSAEHKAPERVIAFGPVQANRRALAEASRTAAAWVGRLAADLRTFTKW